MTSAYLTSAKLERLSAQLSERDRQVLAYVSELRFLTSSQLGRLCFDGLDARSTRRSLARLSRLCVLERLPQRIGGSGGGSAASVYRLGLAGQRLAVVLSLLPGPARRRPELPGLAFVRHTLAVSELHTQVVAADRDGQVELLERQAEPACWRRFRRHSVQQAVLKPDSFFRLGLGEYEFVFFVEVDQGTEGSRAIETKLREYLVYAASGIEQAERGVFPRVLWTTPNERRAEAIRACVQRLGERERELFTVALATDALAVLTAGNQSQSERQDV